MNIEITVQGKHPGPVITRYDVELKRGQRLKTLLGAQQESPSFNIKFTEGLMKNVKSLLRPK